jgi:nucleoside-diphosphate-sugar epimerase
VKFVKDDYQNFDVIKNEIDNGIVFYCINNGSVAEFQKNPNKYQKINEEDFLKLLNSINKKPIHFFLFSSTYVYSEGENITEDVFTIPQTSYGKSRLKQENLLRTSGIDYTILRLSNIFGYGNFYNIGNMGAIEKFIDFVFLDKKLPINGDGNQLVDYLNKNDLMNLLKILLKNIPKNEIFNICTGNINSILGAAKIIAKIGKEKFDKNVEINQFNENIKMPNSPIMSPSKIFKNFLWRPDSNMISEIEKMMKFRSLQHEW